MTAHWMARRAGRELRQRAGSLAALAGAVALMAVVVGGSLLGSRTLRAFEPLLEENVNVIAYLGDELGPAERTRLIEVLRQIPGVERARLVEPDEALARLRAAAESLGGTPAVAGIEPGFLPRSVEIAVAGGVQLPARTAELAARLRQLPGVVEVDAMSAGLARLLSWMALARRLGLVALVIAGLLAIGIFALALTAGRGPRRREAEVLALLGESPAGIRRSASLTGALAAVAGAEAGALAVVGLFPWALQALERAVGLGPLAHAPALTVREIGLALVAATVLGWLTGRLVRPPANPA
jgi:cell division protein FtsX